MNSAKTGIVATGGFRPEIQGLRALAVALVLIFHVWPTSIPGGYVGVDVFFVISGYLITKVLFDEFSATGRISVGRFYERRIRRLMPAATVVLISCAVLMYLLPATRWEDTSKGIIASAIYLQNWWLSSQAVDYLAAESAPGMLNHFWSLSVEEQYYIVWPAMLLVLGFAVSRLRLPAARSFSLVVLLVVLASLGYSVWLTQTNPQQAYFSTFTRAWELGIGGILSVTTRWRSLPPRLRDICGIVGVAMIAVAAFGFSTGTPFPGYAALLPTVGAALVIVAADSTSPFSAYAVMKQAPMQFLGDISYSLYLWHWPVIIVFTALAGHDPGIVEGLMLIVVSCALAFSSKQLVEDSFRKHGKASSVGKAFVLGGACILLSCAAAYAVVRVPTLQQGGGEAREVAGGSAPARSNPGADALFANASVDPSAALLPALEHAKDDFPAPYREKCISRGSDSDLRECNYGHEGGKLVLLVGDANAAQWQPALAGLATANNWDLRVLSKTGCILGDVPVSSTGLDQKRQQACEAWEARAIARSKELNPAVVFISQNATPRLADSVARDDREELLAGGLRSFADAAKGAASKVAFIKGTPSIGKACSDVSVIRECYRDRSESTSVSDPMTVAADISKHALVDFTDGICNEDRCNAVVGNVVVFRSPGQLTATYAQSMAGFVASKLDQASLFEEPLKVAQPQQESVNLAGLAARAMAAKRDNPDLYRDGCHLNQVDTEPRACVYGNKDAKVKIVLTGDSHSAQWLPPLQDIAIKNGWQVYSFTKSACAFSDTTVQVSGRDYDSCTEWNRNVMAEIGKLKPQLLVMSQSRGQRAAGTATPDESSAKLAAGLVSRWRTLSGLSVPVLVIADTPWMLQDIPDCLSSPSYSAGSCDAPVDKALRIRDSLLDAHAQMPAVTMINVNDQICDQTTCYAVRGGTVAYRDRHHLTATFVRTLSGEIENAAAQAMK